MSFIKIYKPQNKLKNAFTHLLVGSQDTQTPKPRPHTHAYCTSIGMGYRLHPTEARAKCKSTRRPARAHQ